MGLPPLPPTPISGARFWHDFSVFLHFSVLPGLSGALLGAVHTDLISRIRFSGPELLVLSLFWENDELKKNKKIEKLIFDMDFSISGRSGADFRHLQKILRRMRASRASGAPSGHVS